MRGRGCGFGSAAWGGRWHGCDAGALLSRLTMPLLSRPYHLQWALEVASKGALGAAMAASRSAAATSSVASLAKRSSSVAYATWV